MLVERAGPLTTVQDLGRPGHAHLGVPRSGAADRVSFLRANRLVGNGDGAAALEMTLSGARLRFERATCIALTGAPMPARLTDRAVPHDTVVAIAAGDTLAVGAAPIGVRTYLAVCGGLDAPIVLGSRSTDLLSGLGPPVVRDGDRFAIGHQIVGHTPGPGTPIEIADAIALRFLPGPRDDWFAPIALTGFAASTYTVDPRSNRVGVRLDGPRLARAVEGELPSEGLVPGAIQVPADGRPLVFLVDHPTTGGYPVIGVVVPDDLPRVAQARPGSKVTFRAI
ncbi:MAG TPA: biotin-dependent carboxyltransferase family protein [Nevskiaceae bacterium]|nr:biotin-dependent carboxyltransferase family protein [Nevskiaceae bacterium]